MLNATGFPVLKRYVVDGQDFYYRNAQHPGAPLKDVVQVFYQLKNEQTSGLGMPMPAGIVRVYQADSKGGLQFVGEDRIDHTPKDETINLKIGNAFDVVCERKQTDFQKIASNVYDVEYEVTLRNHKAIAGHRRGERADRRHVAHAAVLARSGRRRTPGPRSSRCRCRSMERRYFGIKCASLTEHGRIKLEVRSLKFEVRRANLMPGRYVESRRIDP